MEIIKVNSDTKLIVVFTNKELKRENLVGIAESLSEVLDISTFVFDNQVELYFLQKDQKD